MSWMTAITDHVNSLLKSTYDGPSIPPTTLNVAVGDGIDRFPPPQKGLTRLDDRGLSCSGQGAPIAPAETQCQEPREVQLPGRRIWRLDSETEIALDGPQMEHRSP